MKKYSVITERVVFAIGKENYVLKKGDVVELDDKHITTQALIEKKRIVEYKAKETKAKSETDKTE